ncbi:hypothetical protein EOA13_02630 [Mesorhizobium sp. M7A.F.Ca.US.011.01.1.1]|uniref:hypothetical protein n=1 Tax=Mesorhizobium sp. M7A.F.Ca.US.011.01.1.1 TaxID=2496741 RepID=UPI000FCB82A1|nr:hypothetical protein [Mesorhizobium sp. M7A.F.Ca.US.011.01.1.1]RUX31899.1 hypothetical protein EOA13_02630 [Mesorhizobium sp. M7A.F.Ca.US.011.01.1.1]
MAQHFTLDQCRRQGKLHGLAKGKYVIEYNDSTHLSQDQWVRLAEVDVRAAAIPMGEEDTEQFYTIRKDIGPLPAEKADDASKRNARILHDTLSLALARAGILAPDIPNELFIELLTLGEEDGVIVVPDTNALHNGALHWLLQVLKRPAVWILPLAASLTTVQQRDAMVKSLVGKANLGNLTKALRSRGLVNGALGLLLRNRSRSQVVELDHSLLRYQKTGSNSGSDPDNSDVLEDRLIIEGIHGVLRTMRTRSTRRVITSDVNMARVLEAEGIDTLFVPSISMGSAPIDCIRYDALACRFLGAPLCSVIWELVHAFGSIRLMKEPTPIATFDCFWPGKSPADWSSESLSCTFSDRPKPPSLRRGGNQDESEPDGKPETERREDRKNAPFRVARGERTREKVTMRAGLSTDTLKTPTVSVRLGTILPRASLPQAFKFLGTVRRLNGAKPAQIAELSPGTTPDTVRRAFELLRRIGLLDDDAGTFRATRDADAVEKALGREDLDAVSLIIQRFEPYAAFLELLQSLGEIQRGGVVPLLQQRFGSIGAEEGGRLPRFHSLLGQAWTDGDVIRDGSRRLTDRDAGEAFDRAYAATSVDGLAKVIELLPLLCKTEHISPWAVKKQIERFIAEGLLPEYRFEPSAGGKPVSRDEILSGQLEDLTTRPVIIDRLHIGERPVFTIGGPSR